MTQAVKIPIRFAAPVELPAPVFPTVHLIAKPVNGPIVEAVPCADAQGYCKGRWLVVERDPENNLIRESLSTYACAKLAFDAYWCATADDPLEFEAWIAPIWATDIEAA